MSVDNICCEDLISMKNANSNESLKEITERIFSNPKKILVRSSRTSPIRHEEEANTEYGRQCRGNRNFYNIRKIFEPCDNTISPNNVRYPPNVDHFPVNKCLRATSSQNDLKSRKGKDELPSLTNSNHGCSPPCLHNQSADQMKSSHDSSNWVSTISNESIENFKKNENFSLLPVEESSKYGIPQTSLSEKSYQNETSNCDNEPTDVNKISPYILQKSSQNIANLLLHPTNSSYPTKNIPSLKRNKMGKSLHNQKYHSNLDLNSELIEESFKDSRSYSPHSLNKTLSYSLGNLSLKSNNYDHVQSKVKQYIQERKRQDSKAKGSYPSPASLKVESKSLPATPLKRKKKASPSEQEILMLDGKTLESLSISNLENKDALPEDLKKLKEDFIHGEDKSSVLASIFAHLKRERECRIDQDITINTLQLDYDNLLAKYAQAKNMIDNLRFYKDFHERNSEDLSSAQSHRGVDFRKAFSTSNIFVECSTPISSKEERRRSVNLVKYSSSPIVDSNIFIPLNKDRKHVSLTNLSTCNSVLTEIKDDRSICSSSEMQIADWFEKCKYVNQKLSEFFILESNSALEEEERNIVWNYIIDKCNELSLALDSFDKIAVIKQGCQKSLEDVKDKIESFSHQFEASKSGSNDRSLSRPDEEDLLPFDDGIGVPASDVYPCSDVLNLHSLTPIARNQTPPTVKQFLQKDGDSGVPPSDRSTKNSNLESSDHLDYMNTPDPLPLTNYNCASSPSRRAGYKYERKDPLPSNFVRTDCINLSSIKLNVADNDTGTNDFIKCMGSTSNQMLGIQDEGYDASGSSDMDDLNGLEDRKYVRKRQLKPPRDSHFRTSQKYEEKFIRGHRSDSLRNSREACPSFSAKEPITGLSKIEKNSKYINKVIDFKLKGLQKIRIDKNTSKSLSDAKHNTPLKALSKESLNLSNLNFHPCNSRTTSTNLQYLADSSSFNTKPLQKNKDISRISSRASKENCHEGRPEGRCKCHSPDCLPNLSSSSSVMTNRNVDPLVTNVCKRHHKKHRKEVVGLGSVPLPTSKEFHTLPRKSSSVPFLNTERRRSSPYICIDNYNQGVLSEDFSKCSEIIPKNQVLQSSLLKCKKTGTNIDKNLLASLNEAIYTAEKIRLRLNHQMKFMKNEFIPPNH